MHDVARPSDSIYWRVETAQHDSRVTLHSGHKRYKKDLLKATDIVVADAFFSIRPFVDGIKECGFHLVSRFMDTASLYYVYTGPRSHKSGRPKTLDGKSVTEKTYTYGYL